MPQPRIFTAWPPIWTPSTFWYTPKSKHGKNDNFVRNFTLRPAPTALVRQEILVQLESRLYRPVGHDLRLDLVLVRLDVVGALAERQLVFVGQGVGVAAGHADGSQHVPAHWLGGELAVVGTGRYGVRFAPLKRTSHHYYLSSTTNCAASYIFRSVLSPANDARLHPVNPRGVGKSPIASVTAGESATRHQVFGWYRDLLLAFGMNADPVGHRLHGSKSLKTTCKSRTTSKSTMV